MLVLQAAANTGNPGEKQAAIYFNERAVRGLPSRTTSDLGHGQVGDKASGGWSIFIGNIPIVFWNSLVGWVHAEALKGRGSPHLSHLRFKFWPNSDSLGLQRLGRGWSKQKRGIQVAMRWGLTFTAFTGLVGFPVEVAGNGSQQFLEKPRIHFFFSESYSAEAIQSAVLSPPAGS